VAGLARCGYKAIIAASDSRRIVLICGHELNHRFPESSSSPVSGIVCPSLGTIRSAHDLQRRGSIYCACATGIVSSRAPCTIRTGMVVFFNSASLLNMSGSTHVRHQGTRSVSESHPLNERHPEIKIRPSTDGLTPSSDSSAMASPNE